MNEYGVASREEKHLKLQETLFGMEWKVFFALLQYGNPYFSKESKKRKCIFLEECCYLYKYTVFCNLFYLLVHFLECIHFNSNTLIMPMTQLYFSLIDYFCFV